MKSMRYWGFSQNEVDVTELRERETTFKNWKWFIYSVFQKSGKIGLYPKGVLESSFVMYIKTFYIEIS